MRKEHDGEGPRTGTGLHIHRHGGDVSRRDALRYAQGLVCRRRNDRHGDAPGTDGRSQHSPKEHRGQDHHLPQRRGRGERDTLIGGVIAREPHRRHTLRKGEDGGATERDGTRGRYRNGRQGHRHGGVSQRRTEGIRHGFGRGARPTTLPGTTTEGYACRL